MEGKNRYLKNFIKKNQLATQVDTHSYHDEDLLFKTHFIKPAGICTMNMKLSQGRV